ncbi:ABC transporter ATP-binding protein/permease [Pseudothauera nasutitermitis]|uniref:ABC transporter ATP-binding protein/permease n=1 Tax=Pseudothauera nasutitermitis TaxID=2565930 RepID=A0A4S4B3X6_9RHOO|nr:ABC transporter ATP-binding protein/permease [Pseudothauera nasutitermitis]THF66971.1 ABC transporter ATP-binding protein/permease [Pseudothauera nasutitermitis]
MRLLRVFLALARPFWWSRAGWPGWLLLAAVFAMGMGIVQVNVHINAWSKTFYDTLATFDGAALLDLMGEYALAIVVLILVVVSKDWLTKALILRWRQHLNDHLLEAWFADRSYYRLGLEGEPDHPDQRIAEDARLLAESSVGLLVSFFINTLQIGAFVGVLWGLSGTQTFSLGGYSLTLDGYLVWAAVLYTLIGTLLTHWLGRPLHGLNYERQRHEAAFRADLLRKRDHAEQIALYAGEAAERQGLGERFAAIAGNWRALMHREFNLGLFTVGYSRFSNIVPVFVALPAFLAKTITLGGLMQIRTAFGAVQGSLSWFISAYRELAAWSATVERLGQFQQALERSHRTRVEIRRGEIFATCALDVLKPSGEVLLHRLNLHAAPGEWLLLAGASGLGKSTLLRTLGGLWPYYSGDWQLPAGRCLLLPQRPYLAGGRLDRVLAYPGLEVPDEATLRVALAVVGLERLGDGLAREAEWSRELSGGEQQRLSLARALLWRPDTLFLDEATNQLEEQAARGLLQCLREWLPTCTVIAVSHQPGVQTLFARRVELSMVAGRLAAVPA